MLAFRDMTIAEIVANDIRYADIFKRYGIDFCCGGKIALTLACEQRGIDPEEIIAALAIITSTGKTDQDFASWELNRLVSYIVDIYHLYTIEALSLLVAYGAKVARVHGDETPKLREIYKKITELQTELLDHMKKEENVLFPYIIRLIAMRDGAPLQIPPFRTIKNPIAVMDREHVLAGDALKELALLTENFTPPSGACTTYRALYSKLAEFQEKTFEHIHVENNILFPRAIILEEELFNRG